jgi:G:T-mismatch repair DNA endonuclease (very short patch repair protein)
VYKIPRTSKYPLEPRETSCEVCANRFLQPSPYQTLRFCSVRCRNENNGQLHLRQKGVACPKCGHYGYRKGALCFNCVDVHPTGVRVWHPEEIEFLRQRYPEEGAEAVAAALGKDATQVRDKASKLGICLTEEARYRIVHEQARIYMSQANPMKRPEVREKVRQWGKEHPEALAAIQEAMWAGHQQLQRDKPSKLEQRLRDYLDALGVIYEPSARIKSGFIVDIRVGFLIIQADGDYWHGHPRFEPLTERQQKQQRRDRAQDAYLATCGYTVVRIWECELTPALLRTVLRENDLLSD